MKRYPIHTGHLYDRRTAMGGDGARERVDGCVMQAREGLLQVENNQQGLDVPNNHY